MTVATSAAKNIAQIRTVVFREEDLYIAQCIDFDIATQAPDIDTLLDRLELTVEAECALSSDRGEEPFSRIPPAPNYFHKLWEKGSFQITRLNVPFDAVKIDAKFAKAA
jgi:hypothetical protein